MSEQNFKTVQKSVKEQQIKGWLLSPKIWFLLAIAATFFNILSAILNISMSQELSNSYIISLIWVLIWCGIPWITVWKRWSHIGIQRKSYLRWTYTQGAFIFIYSLTVLFSLLALPAVINNTTGIMQGYDNNRILPLYIGSLIFSILTSLTWIAQTIAIPRKLVDSL